MMSEPGWSPGPWTWSPEAQDAGIGVGLGMVHAPCGFGVFEVALPTLAENRRAECEANARLMALSPEMYTELEQAANHLLAITTEPERHAVARRILSLLAKVRGDALSAPPRNDPGQP